MSIMFAVQLLTLYIKLVVFEIKYDQYIAIKRYNCLYVSSRPQEFIKSASEI